MSYILAVNPSIISKTGGTCVDIADEAARDACKADFYQDLITATAASSCLATFIMGLFANLPHGLAPGMGMNAYFTYAVVGAGGFGPVPYRTALACVFLEGIVFALMALTGTRLIIAKLIPRHIKYATTVGIGLFLALLGCGPAEGIGIVASDTHTFSTLAGCGHMDQSYENSFQCAKQIYGTQEFQSTGNTEKPLTFAYFPEDAFCGCEYSGEYDDWGDMRMRGATTWMGIAGFLLITVLMVYKVRGAVLIGITLISIVSWIRGSASSPNPASYFPYTDAGNARFDVFKKVADFHQIKTSLFEMDFDIEDMGAFLTAFFTLLYVDILDTTGTLYSMTDFAGLLDKKGNFPGSTAAFTADAMGTSLGALLGTSPVTTYIESGAGINEGGCTGVTAMVISFMFFISLFFSPILASIPPWASGPALIYVGCLMMRSVTKINWEDLRQAIPAAVTIFMMPFTYSIAYGIISGLLIAFTLWIVDVITCTTSPFAFWKGDEEEEENVKTANIQEDVEASPNKGGIQADPNAQYGL